MKNVKKNFDLAKQQYDDQESPIDQISATVQASIQKLAHLAQIPYGVCSGKKYCIYKVGRQKSRPFLPKLLITDPAQFNRSWNELLQATNRKQHCFDIDEQTASRVIYTCVMAFAICYDLWKPKSRKTPGTFFEVILGALISLLLPEATRTKYVTLPPPKSRKNLVASEVSEIVLEQEQEALQAGEEYASDDARTVSTDIVFNLPSGYGIVIPAKITTRERIVQPFAHQRILDSAMGMGRYISLLTCVSETQRDDKTKSVKEICVPGTITLFQEHLAKLGGIYYLDPPKRYLSLDEDKTIVVKPLAHLVTKGLNTLVRKLQKTPSARAN